MEKSASTLIFHGNTQKKQLAFTYDTGFEDKETNAILKVLEKHGVKCTFFVTGIWAETFPDLIKKIVAEGHELGNHSYRHPDMTQISYQEMLRTVKEGEEAIERVTGVNPRPLFRTPYGAYNDEVLKAVGEAGYPYSIYWSVDTIDWKLPPAAVIADRVIRRAGNGDIVLMHVAGNNTAAAADRAIKKLKTQGFGFATVSQLIK